jgi:hypothetical protein
MSCVGKGYFGGSNDIAYLMDQEAERIRLANQSAEYYSLNRGRNVNPLYGEPTNDPLYGGTNPKTSLGDPLQHERSWNFCPDIAQGESPLVIPCAFEYVEADNRQPLVRPEGKYVEHDAVMSLATVSWICAIQEENLVCIDGREPKEGDVVYGFGKWWDVVNAGKSGAVLATLYTVGWRLMLKVRTQFVPNRKVDLET